MTAQAALPLPADHPDYRGNLPMSDAEILAFVSELRRTSRGFLVRENHAADALTALYTMVMKADADELEGMAEDVASSARAYALEESQPGLEA